MIIGTNDILETNGYSITALNEFVNNGVVQNTNGGSPGCAATLGSSCSTDGGNGPDTKQLTNYVSGGDGGNGVKSTYYGATLKSGAGGAGAGAVSSTTKGNPGGSYGGGGGAGSATSDYSGGGAGGGDIIIYANEFINNGAIYAQGSPGVGGYDWPGGGGGGGYIYIQIYTSIPSYVNLGAISVNGGNGGSVNTGTIPNCESGVDAGAGGGGGGGVVNISIEPALANSINPGSYSGNYLSITAYGGSPGTNPSKCYAGSSGSDGEIIITEMPSLPPPLGCTGLGESYSQTSGYCIFLNQTSITTNYDSDNRALGGTLTTSSSSTSNSPVTANELTYNNQSAQWLLTCPLAPNQFNTSEYFQTGGNSFVAGDRCLANQGSLTTTININTTIFWNSNTIANSTTKFSVTNPGVLSITNLGFSGSAQLPNSQNSIISNVYNTQSYIFQEPITQNESGLFTWNFKFANFSKVTPQDDELLSQKQRIFPKAGSTFGTLEYTNSSSGCTYNYTFTESVKFSGISNHDMPVPVDLLKPLPNRIVFSNGTSSETSNTATAGTGCAQWLFWDGGIYGGSACDFNVNVVSSHATFYYDNNPQPGSEGLHGGSLFSGYCLLGAATQCTPGYSYVYTANTATTSNSINKYAGDYLVATATAYSCYLVSTCYRYSAYAIPASQLHFSNVKALPYFLYNFSAPATSSDVNGRTRYLNESYDVYSAHNYLNPNALDPYTLHTGSGFFATIINSSGDYMSEFPVSETTPSNTAFSSPNTRFTTALNSSQQSSITPNSILQSVLSKSLGNFKQGQIPSPTFMMASPNDYIYIIDHSTKSSALSSSTYSYLYTARFIPYGYYNLTNLQPNFVTSSLFSSNSTWNSTLEKYWSDALSEQDSDFFITGILGLTGTDSYACWSWDWFHCVSGGSGMPKVKEFVPTSMASDYADDIFLAGIDTKSSEPELELAASFSNGTYINNVVKSSGDAGFTLAQDIAVTSGGQFIYLSNLSYPNIPMFSANTLTYTRNITLNYSNSTYWFNISSYLAHGGPYGNTLIANTYTGVGNVIDTASNHHPVAIFDYGDLLYVIDNWTFTVNGLSSSMLMLRVFFPNGTEIPIHYASYDDLMLNSSLASSADLYVANSSAAPENPPYGWPLSVNISTGNGNSISYCVADCTFNPNSIGVNYTGYPPIGPFINSSGLVGLNSDDLGFTINYNGTVYMLAHSHANPVPNYGDCGSASGECPYYTATPLYTEFLRFKPNIINYTKISLSAYAPYSCMVSNTIPNYAGPCVENNYISELYPPFASVPSPSKFVFGEGSAATYYDAQVAVESLFPTNSLVSSYGSSYATSSSCSITSNEIVSKHILNASNLNNITIGNTNLEKLATFVNLTSRVGGYALLPYNVSYTVSKSWDVINVHPSSCAIQAPLGTTNTIVYNGISAFQINYTPTSNVTEQIDGGPTFLQYFGQNNYYNANLSDAGLILPPSLEYEVFTNRLFGSIYANQTINPAGSNTPLLINATKVFDYGLTTESQNANGNTYNGYAFENIYPVSSSGPVYGPANSPLTNPNTFTENSLMTFSNSSVSSYTNIFQQFNFFKNADTLDLLFPNANEILGYNRILYVFQDAFNNTVSAPIDVDFANTTIISVNATPTVNAYNSNLTNIVVNGSAYYITGTYVKNDVPLPAGSPIYLYYDTPLNYYNATVTPTSSPSSYYEYAEQCALGSNHNMNCTLANPLSEYIQGANGIMEANQITFHTQYNSSKGECPQPPKQSLLNVTVPINCNMYTDPTNSISYQVSPNSPTITYTEYCEPEFSNGSGIFTSQLGLIAIAETNSQGEFSYNSLNVCGTGSAAIIAKYFGGPYPEPQKYSQPSIQGSVQSLAPAGASTPISVFEYNYTNSENQTSTSFDTGSYYLKFGGISIAITVILAMAVMAYGFISQKRRLRAKSL